MYKMDASNKRAKYAMHRIGMNETNAATNHIVEITS